MAHDFAKQSVVCDTLCRRCRENTVAAGEGKGSRSGRKTADWAYMKAPIFRPMLRLVDKVSQSCGHTPGKVAGQRGAVKAEMNGFIPGLDHRPPSR